MKLNTGNKLKLGIPEHFLQGKGSVLGLMGRIRDLNKSGKNNIHERKKILVWE